MSTTTDAKHIQYDRETRDWSATFDGQYIGSFPTPRAAEDALNDYALDLIEQGLVDGLQVLARPAEVVEVLHGDEPTPTGQEPGGSGGGGGSPIQRWREQGAREQARIAALPHFALPAAPAANPIEARTPGSFSGPNDSTATGREDAAAYCPDLAACEANSCPACETPVGHFMACTICGGPHRPTQCPKVALAKYGIGVWESYLDDRKAFLKLVQWGSAQRLALMGEAVAFYLSHRWGGPITGYQVLASWQQNAALA